MKRKLVQFGAGNIGRSFLGQLFSRGGYEVVFIDIDDELIRALNRKHSYRVVIKRNDRPDEILLIKNVRGIHSSRVRQIAAEVADCRIAGTAVGQKALPAIIPVLAEGLKARWKKDKSLPLDIILAENLRSATALVKTGLAKFLPDDYPIDRLVGLIETSIGKMVPIMKEEHIKEDRLWVFAEEYNTLILDKRGFRNPIPGIAGLAPKDNIRAYVDRKLFIHNLGHAAAGYLGFQAYPELIYIYEALARPEILEKTRKCMREAKCGLLKEYPDDFTDAGLEEHIADLLSRFQNRSLGDTIFRIGRDLYRKLGKEDRLIGAMLLARKRNCRTEGIAEAVRAAINFRAKDENGDLFSQDKRFVDEAFPRGTEYILTNISGLSKDNPLEKAIIDEITLL